MGVVARRFFELNKNVDIVNTDGKSFLDAYGGVVTFDLIFLDAFVGYESDKFLYSKEGLELISKSLAIGGVLVVNNIEKDTELGYFKKILSEVFDVFMDDVKKHPKLDKSNVLYFCRSKNNG